MSTSGKYIKPAVSVVLPAFNAARSLEAAIGSVRMQEWTPLEIIVVDDGSVDDTLDVLKQLAASDLKTIQQPNQGPAAARNTGIQAARGEWIAFQDADDLWLPGKLSAQFEQLDRSPGAAFCYSYSVFREPDGDNRELRCDTSGRPLLFELLKGNMLSTPTMVVQRECFETVGFFDPELRTGEDWDLWLRLAAFFPSTFVPRTLVSCLGWSNMGKYELDTLERCTLLPLGRLFSNEEILESWPQLVKLRPMVYAWHYSVLAKSYFHSGRAMDFLRMVTKAMLAHPTALKNLTSKRGLKWTW
jgi:glycosyltransferase involved in cell wall biosynthesis